MSSGFMWDRDEVINAKQRVKIKRYLRRVHNVTEFPESPKPVYVPDSREHEYQASRVNAVNAYMDFAIVHLKHIIANPDVLKNC